MKTEVIEAKVEHAAKLVKNMTEEERAFIRKFWDTDATVGLEEAVCTSVLCWTVLIDGETAAMFGVTKSGCTWLTTSPLIDKAKYRFVKYSRAYIKEMQRVFTVMRAYAHRDNTKLINWLENWAGFKCEGVMGEFIFFTLRREY